MAEEKQYIPRVIEPDVGFEGEEETLPKPPIKEVPSVGWARKGEIKSETPLTLCELPISNLLDVPIGENIEKLKALDRYIKEEIANRKWRSIFGSYKQIFKELAIKIGITDFHSGKEKLNLLITGLGLKIKSRFHFPKELTEEQITAKANKKIRNEIFREVFNELEF